MTGQGSATPGAGLRLDIGSITLHGYAPARRDRFAVAIAARLSRAGAPAEAARQAAEAILTAVAAQVERPERPERGRDHG
jgi:hypothetical protein